MADFPALIELSNLGSFGFKIQADGPVENAARRVSSAGDVNGDGYDDIIIGARGHDGGGYDAGAAYLIFGKAGGFSTIHFGALAAADGFKIQGDAPGDGAGWSTSSAGDVNGDGFDDYFVGVPFDDGGAYGLGAVYLIYGKASGFGPLDLGALAATDGFRIEGAGGLGLGISAAGDVNGDGFDDMLFGAPRDNPLNTFAGNDTGGAYVVFGKAGGFASIDLHALAAADGFKILGESGGDAAGRQVSSAGDVNGDGFDDIFIAAVGNESGGYGAGAAYVIYGKAGGFGTVALGALTPAVGFKIQGASASDAAGYSISSAGDVNGDGFGDLIIGAPFEDGAVRGSGAAYVIFGKAGGFTAINLSSLAPADGFKIRGEVSQRYDFAGWSVSSAGDVNGDGFDDVIVGATQNEIGGNYPGAAYVIFGKASGFADIDLATLNGADGFKIEGETAEDMAGFSVSSAGDVNGDGFGDVLVGAHRNDGGGAYAGAAYVIFGIGPTAAVTRIGSAADQTIRGGAGDDTLDGVGGDDSLFGAGGADILIGGTGADLLDGWAGADSMTGGLGNDVFVVDDAGDVVIELTGEGSDEVRTWLASYSLASSEHVEKLTGLGAGDQSLTGNGADNVIDGGLGADAMAGGIGNDVFIVDNAGDTIVELDGAGIDEVRTALASFSIAGIANVETLTGTSNAGQVLTGNGSANIILAGSGGDVIDGGLGADSMTGGLGNDIYFVDDAGDMIAELGGAGDDEVRASVASFSIANFANVERLTGLGSLDHALNGNASDNIIDGGLGADAMAGGGGNDIFIVDNAGDTIMEVGSNGTDEVRTALASFSIAGFMNVENLTGTSNAGQALTGNGSDNLIVTGVGNDVIDGGLGADVMAGGLGDDVYVVDNGLDLVTETAGGGSDELRTSLAAYSLGGLPEIEKLTGISSLGQTLTGNGLANTILGGSGNDFIDGGAGNDSMTGGLGNDIFVVANPGDIVSEGAEQGIDEVRTVLGSFSLAGIDNVENLTGGAANQTLTGNGSNNVIDGGLGADAMAGGGGNDVYIVDSLSDTVTEGDFQGVDEIRTGLSSYSIAGIANVENLSGGAGDQTLIGNGLDNVIDGAAGADAMAGGGGNDVYAVDNLGDVVTEFDSAGIDEVRTALGSKAPPDRLVYVLPNFIENLTGTSAGAQGVRDNALSNVIIMSAGHDLVVADAGGIDSINGGGGNDFIYHGDKLTAADITNGGAGSDTIGLLGDYGSGITFTASNLVGVERMALYTSLYLPGTGPNNYTLTMHDANVAAGTEFFVTAASLQSNESLVFNGAAETSGRFTIHGGGGADTIIGGGGGDFVIGNAGNDSLYGLGGHDFLSGGLGADLLRGGAGSDRFLYQNVAQSTVASTDQILDFQHVDRIDLSAIDAVSGGANDAFTFIGSSAFTNTAGQLRAYQNGADWFVEGDTNGDGLADLVIQVTLPDATPLGGADFIL